jgi:hypothetical protein
MCSPEVYQYPKDIDVVGQVAGLAMRLDQGHRRRMRSQAARAEPLDR